MKIRLHNERWFGTYYLYRKYNLKKEIENMKKMKNLLLCSGMVLVLALAAGCGDASEKDDQNGTVTEDQETTDETTDENDTMDENTTEGTTDKDTDKDVDTPSEDLGDGVKDLGDGVGDAVEDVGDAVGDAFDGEDDGTTTDDNKTTKETKDNNVAE
ncbi:hypothetical protein RUMHYD_01122 [Blautia hydrogenotrophica DSM 10507]|uniref:Uncharacterized protein n=2 Tax=Blautia hydrogenotrophica TaxID=53443 RepID=C0CJV2_BLAHS|nr:hypothetical protein RUMHYD_01122 [Blautia hydrogenotrophica DSM 10507]